MQFTLDDSLFEKKTDQGKLIGLIYGISVSSLHIVVPRNPTSKVFVTWLEGLGPISLDIQQLLNSYYRSAATRRFIKKVVVAAVDEVGTKLNTIDIESAIALTKKSFRIYVENSRNDRRFLLAACTEAQRNRLQLLCDANELEFINGGGISELKQQIENDFADGRLISDFSWAFFDSDALVPGQASGQSIALKTTCTNIGMNHAQLTRRAIENYATKRILNNWVHSRTRLEPRYSQRKATFQVFLKLPVQLSHHFNMKHGITQDRKRHDYPANDAIYQTLDNADIRALEQGFGNDLSEAFDWGLTEPDLKAEGSWTELQTMIGELEALL